MKRFKGIENKWFKFILFLIFITPLFTSFLQAVEHSQLDKVEKNLLPPVLIKGDVPWTLQERMDFYHVPGVSVVVINNFKVDAAKGYGVMDSSTKVPVNVSTRFQAASLSKSVAALAALKDYRDGKLKWDTNIDNYLISWKLPSNAFTSETPVTIRHLLSHTGGITVHGFRGYAVNETLPSLLDVLDGKPPANSAPIIVDIQPGKQFRYAGGGYCILQQLMIDVDKLSFPEIMKKNVLDPLGMNDSTYLQPLPTELQKNAASGHNAMGMPIPGKWHIYPEMAAAGLWTTPSDLAKFIIEIQLSLKNKSNKILSKELSESMLTPYLNENYGLGVSIIRYGDSIYFEHSGQNEGFICRYVASKEKGYGAIVMTNSDSGAGLYNEIIRGIADVYKWEGFLPQPVDVIKVSPDILKTYTGKFALNSDQMASVVMENDSLKMKITSMNPIELFPVAKDKFISRDITGTFTFETDPATKQVTRLNIERNGQQRSYERKTDDLITPMELLLSGKIEEAFQAYRELKTKNPNDPMIQPMRLLATTQQVLAKGNLKVGVGLLGLTAELYPDVFKAMYTTLNNEIQLILDNPSVPEEFKKGLKAGYNAILKKLELKELD